MENQANNKNIILIYGLIAGLAAILIALSSYLNGNNANPGALFSSLSFLLPLVIIVLGIKKVKKKNQGILSWEQAIKTGVGIALIWGILTLSFQYILENIIDPELLIEKIELFRERETSREVGRMTDEAIEKEVEKLKNQNPLIGNAFGLLAFIFIGFIVSAISGAIMKKTTDE